MSDHNKSSSDNYELKVEPLAPVYRDRSGPSPFVSDVVVHPSGKKEYVVHCPVNSGSVKLKWHTPDPEITVLEIAKISNDYPNLDNTKLLETTYNGGHFSVYQMANICVEFTTSREIGRQVMRHWSIHMCESLNVQELSQRYKWYGHDDPENVILRAINQNYPNLVIKEGFDYCTLYPFYYKNLMLQDPKNRQASFVPEHTDLSAEKEYANNAMVFYEDQKHVWVEAVKKYRLWQQKGCAREKARCFLPEGMAETRFTLNGTLRSWIHYLNGRAMRKTGIPQNEHEELALKVMDIFKSLCPCIHELMVQGKLTHYKPRERESNLPSQPSGAIATVSTTCSIENAEHEQH